MKLRRLTLNHFRNYEELDLSFGDGLTIFAGENAQGKTNLLEAIFLLSVATSHRTNRDQELIQWDHDQARIYGEVETETSHYPLELLLSSKGKTVKVNHLEQAKLSHFVGKLNVILFAPEDMQIVKGSPSLRRRFIDVELGQSHPVYLRELLNYNRVLRQRNLYLRQHRHKTKDLDPLYLQVLTDQLIQTASFVIRSRYQFVQDLEILAQPLHSQLSKERDDLTLTYKSSHRSLDYQNLDTIEEQLEALFTQQAQREQDQGMTLYGPHRDDLLMNINGRLAQDFASQGQQRTVVLSLKLAEIELLHQLTGHYPVLLLDDVLSELDDGRQHLLMSIIKGKVQTFLTTASTKSIQLDQLDHAVIYQIDQGQVFKGEEV